MENTKELRDLFNRNGEILDYDDNRIITLHKTGLNVVLYFHTNVVKLCTMKQNNGIYTRNEHRPISVVSCQNMEDIEDVLVGLN